MSSKARIEAINKEIAERQKALMALALKKVHIEQQAYIKYYVI